MVKEVKRSDCLWCFCFCLWSYSVLLLFIFPIRFMFILVFILLFCFRLYFCRLSSLLCLSDKYAPSSLPSVKILKKFKSLYFPLIVKHPKKSRRLLLTQGTSKTDNFDFLWRLWPKLITAYVDKVKLVKKCSKIDPKMR